MVSQTRKRSRATVNDERAECPFELHVVPFPAARTGRTGRPLKNRSKPVNKNKDMISKMNSLFQPPLFEPTGKFSSNATMGIYYHIEPRMDWTSMTRYHSFILNSEKYLSGEFVFVANDNCIARGKLGDDLNAQVRPCNVWVAQILEIRALDERHVYARVCWMYSPDELPGRRRPYYGKNEIIASNHLDIINVLSIVHRAKVSQWIEADDEEVPVDLYWRQALDCGTSQLSAVGLICRCGTPAHPDKTFIGCTSSDCGEWMHIDCLREDVLQRVHDRLRADKPHVPTAKMNLTDSYLGIQRQSAYAPLNAVTVEDEQPSDIISVQSETSTDVLAKCREESDSRSAERSPAVIPQTTMRSKRGLREKTGRPRESDEILCAELFQS